VIVLVGFMGAGKTTVGRMLAEALGTEFVDADAEIESRAGLAVSDIFSSRGEQEFRAMERAVVGDLLARGPGVIAVGGGALQDPTTRDALRARPDTTVVYLEVDHDEAMRRVGGDPGRPLLAHPDVESLHESRLATYRSAAALTVNTTGRSPDEVIGVINEALRSGRLAPAPSRVAVTVHPRPYEVIVGAGILPGLAHEIPAIGGAEKAFAITHPELLPIAESVAGSLRSAGLRTIVLDVPSGESAKSLDIIGELYDRLGKEAAHRNDLIVGVGGGVVTDIAGFVASTFNRGMPVVHVPTTLLGQVDAAIGGKTGINVEHGKNLVGTFYQPSVVVCDVGVLATLPLGEMRAGMAEVVKYGFISAPDLLTQIERDAKRILEADPAVLSEIVARSIEIKASVVAADEREEGGRAVLNYGHTFAHAIEQTVGFGRIRHGEAVAIGMMAAAHLGHVLGRFDEPVVEAHRRVLGAVGLPVTASLDIDALERAWLRDKKYLHGVRFVLLKSIGEAEFGITAPRPAIATALEKLSQ
jgi:shikimate kinase/3-dehydroquinate synthase